MGLGKTISSIALMAGNRQEKKGEPKTTLIVAPLALLQQWADEIESKSEGLSVVVYHGPHRAKLAHKLGRYRCVVTSYDVVSREYVDEKKLEKEGVISVSSDDESDREEVGRGKKQTKSGSKKRGSAKTDWGPLFKKDDGSDRIFWRIILDEAHTVGLRMRSRSHRLKPGCRSRIAAPSRQRLAGACRARTGGA